MSITTTDAPPSPPTPTPTQETINVQIETESSKRSICCTGICVGLCGGGSNNIYYLNCIQHRYLKRRFLLLLIPIIILLYAYLWRDEHVLALATMLFVILWILLYNVPYLSQVMHTRPLYFEDLMFDDNLDEPFRTRFQEIFTIWMNFTVAGLAAILMAYRIYDWRYQWNGWIIEIGALGGIWAIFTRIQNIIGRIALSILMLFKRRRQYANSNNI
jgi:hypothetical protein